MAAAKTKSDNTDAVISSAAAALVKATANIQEAFKSVDSLTETAENLTRDIAGKKAEIESLTETYQTKYRQSEVDFNLKLAEKKDVTVNEYLKSVGKEAVESAAYKALQTNLATAISERDTEVKRAVAIENSRLTRDFNSEKALLESQFQTSTVKQVAQIESLQKENASLTAQVAQLFKQIDAERAAGIERAKASAIGSVNVGTPNGR
jgi:cell division protein FtsB